jgi:CrcB protein
VPAHRHPAVPAPAVLAAVVLGGALGTAARIGVTQVLPRPDGLPLPTLVVNLVGALALGALLEALARAAPPPEGDRRRSARLVAGTGFCGAFTTYGAFAVEADLLARDGRAGVALGYVLGSVLLGLAATSAGLAVGAALGNRVGGAAGGHPGEG